MRIRAQSLGGRLRVSTSTRGTLVTVVAPLGATELDSVEESLC
jgi:signal transduction histidine kinase